jgi:hypothetical protein
MLANSTRVGWKPQVLGMTETIIQVIEFHPFQLMYTPPKLLSFDQDSCSPM